MHDSVWRRAGFDRSAARVFAPGESDHESVAGDRRAARATCSTGTRCWRTTPAGSPSRTVRCESWRHGNVVLLGDAAHTAHFSIGSGTKLAMEDALALAACLHEQPDGRPRAGRVRGGAAAGGAVHPARGAGQPGVVREPRAVRAPGAAAVRLQPADPQPPGDPRQPAAAGPGVRGRRGRLVRPGRGRACRQSTGDRRPADVPAAAAARAGAGQPGGRLADGHVLRGGRRTRPTSTSSTSAARRSAGPGW